jgi:hypothetical protein
LGGGAKSGDGVHWNHDFSTAYVCNGSAMEGPLLNKQLTHTAVSRHNPMELLISRNLPG